MGAGGLLAASASILLGALVALQAPINAMLGRALSSPISAALVSLVVSCGAAVAIHAAVAGPAEWRAPSPWLYLAGGVIGTSFVVGSLFIVPRLGAASFLACVVLGQMLAALVMDHVGAFGLPVRDLTLGRAGAVGCVAAGVALLRFV